VGRKFQQHPIASHTWSAKFVSMKRQLIAIACLLVLRGGRLIAAETSIPQTDSGIALDSPWKTTVFQFAKSNLQHSAWGLAHSERDFQLACTLATEEKLMVDTDVLFAPLSCMTWASSHLIPRRAWIIPNVPRKSPARS